VKIEPNTAVPTEPPIPRSSVTPDVAVPSTAYGTLFWTASTSTCMTRPRPRHSTSRYSDATNVDVPTSSRESRNIPTVITAMPATGNAL
jgi:hypothetical protein